MSKLKQSDGFTLIELMIVVAIIAIIAAIAIPSILRSRISANETSASGSLDSVTKSNQMFRQNDTDGNGVKDYWTADIYGMWALLGTTGERAELIGSGMAGADYLYNSSSLTTGYDGSVSYWGTSPAGSAHPAPKSGYYFAMLEGEYNDGTTSGTCDQTYNNSQSYADTSKFAASAFPETYDSTGRKAYIATAGGEVFVIDAAESSNGLGQAFNSSTDGTVNTSPTTLPNSCVPSQGELSDKWSSN